MQVQIAPGTALPQGGGVTLLLWEWRLATKNLPQDNGQLHDHSRRGRRSHTHSLFWWGAILPGGVVGVLWGVLWEWRPRRD